MIDDQTAGKSAGRSGRPGPRLICGRPRSEWCSHSLKLAQMVLTQRIREVQALSAEDSEEAIEEYGGLRLAEQTEAGRIVCAPQPSAGSKSATPAGRPPMWKPPSHWRSPASACGARGTPAPLSAFFSEIHANSRGIVLRRCVCAAISLLEDVSLHCVWPAAGLRQPWLRSNIRRRGATHPRTLQALVPLLGARPPRGPD
jgi:hypothetical protein